MESHVSLSHGRISCCNVFDGELYHDLCVANKLSLVNVKRQISTHHSSDIYWPIVPNGPISITRTCRGPSREPGFVTRSATSPCNGNWAFLKKHVWEAATPQPRQMCRTDCLSADDSLIRHPAYRTLSELLGYSNHAWSHDQKLYINTSQQ